MDLSIASRLSLTAEATGLPERSIYIELLPRKKTTGLVVTPGKKQIKAQGTKGRMSNMDDLTKSVLRRKVN